MLLTRREAEEGINQFEAVQSILRGATGAGKGNRRLG